MNKTLKTILITSITVFGFGCLLIPSTQAISPLEVQFEETPLFSEANFLPGDGITRWVKVTNNSGETKSIATEAINYPGFPDSNNVPANDLSRVLLIIIREKGGDDLYGGSIGEKSLFNFYQDGETYLSDVPDNSTEEYEFEITFPSERENEWQGAAPTFDILVGFQGTEGDGNGGNGNGGNGGGGGGGTLPPGLTILDESVRITNCCEMSATIIWTTSYFSTSRVVYSADGEPHILNLGAPNYGYTNSKEGDDSGLEKVTGHNVIITGLSPETTYYYRCASHASPPTISWEYKFTTPVMGTCFAFEEGKEGEIIKGGEIIYPGPSAGPGVEGEEGVPEEGVPEEGGLAPELEEIVIGEGEEEKVETGFNRFLAAIGTFFSGGICWLLFLIIVILTILFLMYLTKRKQNRTRKWIHFSILVILVVIYYFLCSLNFKPLIITLIILLILYILFGDKLKKRSQA